jgi:CubicO group peptidase (beta-lactamase class C family)
VAHCVIASGRRARPVGSVGDYHWWGFGGTTFWVDPEERIVAVFMIQGPGHQSRYQRLFRNMVYSAINERGVPENQK